MAAVGVVGLCAALWGCGGGGGGAAPYPLSATTRFFAVGDRWEYRVSGTATAADGTQVAVTGTKVASIVPITISSVAWMAISESLNLRTSSGEDDVTSSVTLFRQDPGSRAIELWGQLQKDGSVLWVTNTPPPPIIPGTWNLATALASSVYFSDGNHNTVTLSVAATEVIGVPGGLFTTWRATTTALHATGRATNGTAWYAPQLGAVVREAATTSFTDGRRLSVTMELISTNIPLG